MNNAFPFAAIVGQDDMKLAMIMTAIDPKIGGVLVFGDRGTGKSTAVRGLANLLPPINSVEGCPVNSRSLDEVPSWSESTSKKIVEIPMPNKPLDIDTNKESRKSYCRETAEAKNKQALVSSIYR